MERCSGQEAHIVRRSMKRHEVVDPGGGGQRTELAVLRINDQVEAPAGHNEPSGFLKAPKGVVRGDIGRPERPLRLLSGKRMLAFGQEPFHECSGI